MEVVMVPPVVVVMLVVVVVVVHQEYPYPKVAVVNHRKMAPTSHP